MTDTTIKHAVLTDSHIVTIDQAERKLIAGKLLRSPRHISDLYEVGGRLGITHFWIMPGSTFDNLGYATLEDVKNYNIFYTRDRDGEQYPEPRAARVRKDGVYGTVVLCYPHRHRFSWAISHPLDILACIDYLQTELKIVVQWSPGHISHQLLRKENSTLARKLWLRESTMNLFDLPFKEAARPLGLRRPLTLDMIGLWLHNYDKNSSYLAASQGLDVGCGDPVYVPREECANIDIKLPGIYHVKVIRSLWNTDLFPPIINREWVTSDILQYAATQGYTLEVLEAWQFPEHHQIFREWARALWLARAALNPENKECDARFPYGPGRLNAYKTVKKIATLGPGRFAMEDIQHDFMRPDWWWLLVGKGRANGLRNLKSFSAHGVYAQFIDNDAITFACDESDPRKAVPGILDREGGLGGYKHEWSLLLTEKIVRQALSLPDGKIVSFLTARALAGEGK